jgi:hypothetical protein
MSQQQTATSMPNAWSKMRDILMPTELTPLSNRPNSLPIVSNPNLPPQPMTTMNRVNVNNRDSAYPTFQSPMNLSNNVAPTNFNLGNNQAASVLVRLT